MAATLGSLACVLMDIFMLCVRVQVDRRPQVEDPASVSARG
jgi:hypothetical protein